MKKVFTLSIMAMLLLLTNAQPVHAQFWKKIFKKEEKRSPRNTKPVAPKKEEKAEKKIKEKVAPEYPDSKRSASYRVDILVPLHLNNLVSNGKLSYTKSIPEHSLPGVNFYEGIAMACDTLKQQNIRLDVYVHDIFDAAGKVDYLLQHHVMDSSDLIIGAVQSGNIPEVAEFARKHKINFVSALSPADAGVKDNPYFILIQPALHTHIRALVKYARGKFGKEQAFILHRSNEMEAEGYNLLKSLLAKDNPKEIKCGAEVSATAFAQALDSNVTNILYMSFLETGYAEKVLQALAKLDPKYKIQIMGMPSWKGLYSITQPGNYPNMEIYFTTPFFFDPTTGIGNFLNEEYKKYSSSKPSEMVYRGYETMYWLSHMLQRYGRYFNNHISDVSNAPFTRYDVSPEYSDDNDFLYLENKELNIYHYRDGGYSVE